MTEISQGCVDPTSSNLARTYERSSQHCIFVSEFGCLDWLTEQGLTSHQRPKIICCIFKCGRLEVEWCFKRRQISHFFTHVKIRGGWARSLYQLLKFYLGPNLLNTFDGRPLRGCWAEWIDKKRNKWSSWAKLKAFPTNVGRPNQRRLLPQKPTHVFRCHNLSVFATETKFNFEVDVVCVCVCVCVRVCVSL